MSKLLATPLILILLIGGCAPSVDSSRSADGGIARESQSHTTKTITIGIQSEPADFFGLEGSGKSGGTKNVETMAVDRLVVLNDLGEYQPQLAVERISVEAGSLRVNPDGTLDAVWSIRPNVKWHDGTPFTAADLVFAFTVRKDPETATRIPGRPDLMRAASAPDPSTFILHWAAPYVNADRAEGLVPLPKHLLEDLYQNDKANLLTSPRLTTDFVGLGPYRLDRWERGSHMEFSRFDEYYQGRPPLDRVYIRFLGDPNTMVSNILSGTVDALLPEGIGVEAALEIQRRWQGTANQVRFDLEGGLRIVDSQYRLEVARPANGLVNRTVRQALYHAIDRKTFAEAIMQGITPIADSWIPASDARRPRLEASIPQYPFDLPRAQQLLSEAGWTRGSDGTLTHSQTGERFETQIWADQENEAIREMNIIADFWKAVGVQATIQPIPPSRLGDREYLASYPGALLSGPPANRLYEDRYHSRSISSAATRWAGTNRFGYSNPQVDALLDQLSTTLSQSDRVGVHQQLLAEMLGDVAVMPLYWEVLPVAAVAGIKGNRVADNTATWDFFHWDRD